MDSNGVSLNSLCELSKEIQTPDELLEAYKQAFEDHDLRALKYRATEAAWTEEQYKESLPSEKKKE